MPHTHTQVWLFFQTQQIMYKDNLGKYMHQGTLFIGTYMTYPLKGWSVQTMIITNKSPKSWLCVLYGLC